MQTDNPILTSWPLAVPAGRWAYQTNEQELRTVLYGRFRAGLNGVVIFEDDGGMRFDPEDFRPGEFFRKV